MHGILNFKLRRAICAALGLVGLLSLSNAISATTIHRLPVGTHWGRCLLVVGGQTRISGKCSYSIEKGGNFHIDGPHQIFSGIDYQKPDAYAGEKSADFWANVFKDGAGWSGYGNTDVRSSHGERETWALHRVGACYLGPKVRVCLWKN